VRTKFYIGLIIAGMIGTLARYFLGGYIQRITAGFPWGTLVINTLGCFLFGFVWVLSQERLLINPENRQIILIGFMGAFTTFSTYAFETGQFLRDSQWLLASANFLGSNFLGLVGLFLGMMLGRKL